MWPCTQFYTPEGLILSDIWAGRFRPATARYPAHFIQKRITMATEVWGKKDSPHCGRAKIDFNHSLDFPGELFRIFTQQMLKPLWGYRGIDNFGENYNIDTPVTFWRLLDVNWMCNVIRVSIQHSKHKKIKWWLGNVHCWYVKLKAEVECCTKNAWISSEESPPSPFKTM